MEGIIIKILSGFIGSCGFAVLYNIRGKKLIFAAMGSLISTAMIVLLSLAIDNQPICYFIAAITLSVYAEIMSRLMRTPRTTFILIALIPLVPGGALYNTMAFTFRGDWSNFWVNALDTLGITIALALGVVLVSATVKVINKRKEGV